MSTWIGNKENGIELRSAGEGLAVNGLDILDEVVVYINGNCVMHMEATSEVNYWFGFYLPDKSAVHMNIGSKNLKSHVVATAEQT